MFITPEIKYKICVNKYHLKCMEYPRTYRIFIVCYLLRMFSIMLLVVDLNNGVCNGEVTIMKRAIKYRIKNISVRFGNVFSLKCLRGIRNSSSFQQ